MDFQMQFRHSNGNLHIRASGGFDGNAAESLLQLFCREYRGEGRIFVDTAGLHDIHPSGRAALGTGLDRTPVPAASLFFMGENGFLLAPDGSRVLTFKHRAGEKNGTERRPAAPADKGEHRCCGNCARCTCRRHQHEAG